MMAVNWSLLLLIVSMWPGPLSPFVATAPTNPVVEPKLCVFLLDGYETTQLIYSPTVLGCARIPNQTSMLLCCTVSAGTTLTCRGLAILQKFPGGRGER